MKININHNYNNGLTKRELFQQQKNLLQHQTFSNEYSVESKNLLTKKREDIFCFILYNYLRISFSIAMVTQSLSNLRDFSFLVLFHKNKFHCFEIFVRNYFSLNLALFLTKILQEKKEFQPI
jgi:hypothetical protein